MLHVTHIFEQALLLPEKFGYIYKTLRCFLQLYDMHKNINKRQHLNSALRGPPMLAERIKI